MVCLLPFWVGLVMAAGLFQTLLATHLRLCYSSKTLQEVWYVRFLTGLARIQLTSFVWLALPQGKQQPLACSRVHFDSDINCSLSHQALERLLPSKL